MTHMKKLISLLEDANIPFETRTLSYFDNSLQIFVPDFRTRDGDVISHLGSYGGEEGLLEIMGFGCENVVGWLTAEDAFKIIKTYYEEQ